MSEPIKEFFRVFNYYDGDEHVMADSWVRETLQNLETWGEDIGEQAEDWIKNLGKHKTEVSNPAKTLPPNFQELNYVEPEHPTTLYNVTNIEKKETLLEKKSNLFSNLSYSVSGWNVEATSELGNGYKASAIAGEENGLQFGQFGRHYESSVTATYNIRNGKSEVEYYNRNYTDAKSLSLFVQKGNYGATASYHYIPLHLSGGVSTDKNGMSMSINWHPEKNVEIGAYANKDYSNSINNVVGIRGRIAIK